MVASLVDRRLWSNLLQLIAGCIGAVIGAVYAYPFLTITSSCVHSECTHLPHDTPPRHLHSYRRVSNHRIARGIIGIQLLLRIRAEL
jgi:hypothetical protein